MAGAGAAAQPGVAGGDRRRGSPARPSGADPRGVGRRDGEPPAALPELAAPTLAGAARHRAGRTLGGLDRPGRSADRGLARGRAAAVARAGPPGAARAAVRHGRSGRRGRRAEPRRQPGRGCGSGWAGRPGGILGANDAPDLAGGPGPTALPDGRDQLRQLARRRAGAALCGGRADRLGEQRAGARLAGPDLEGGHRGRARAIWPAEMWLASRDAPPSRPAR